MRWTLERDDGGGWVLEAVVVIEETVDEEAGIVERRVEPVERHEYTSKTLAIEDLLRMLEEADAAWEAKRAEIAPLRARSRALRQLAGRLGHRA